MWRVQRLDQINAFKPANLFDFKSLALKFGKNRLAGLKQSSVQSFPARIPDCG
jgi:hypothetical protein